ncbi:hypothetical protein, partial [Pseudomonas aeruginosa]
RTALPARLQPGKRADRLDPAGRQLTLVIDRNSIREVA